MSTTSYADIGVERYKGRDIGAVQSSQSEAIDNDKLSLISYQQMWNVPMPVDLDASFDQGNKQHLIAQYSGISWQAPGGVVLIAQCRSVARRVFSRIFGRVN